MRHEFGTVTSQMSLENCRCSKYTRVTKKHEYREPMKLENNELGLIESVHDRYWKMQP